jgi:uncharacterized membrane protein
MELVLRDVAANVALAAELACVLCIAIGAALAVIKTAQVIVLQRLSQQGSRRAIFKSFAVWIILALEFALAADIVRSAIAPTWNDIGQLAAIAVIRTGLNYFLEKDLAEISDKDGAVAESAA